MERRREVDVPVNCGSGMRYLCVAGWLAASLWPLACAEETGHASASASDPFLSRVYIKHVRIVVVCKFGNHEIDCYILRFNIGYLFRQQIVCKHATFGVTMKTFVCIHIV